MDAVLIARQLRLATIMNFYNQGLLEEKDARELLDGPLTPGDDSTIVKDSKYFNDIDGLIRDAELHRSADTGRDTDKSDSTVYIPCPDCHDGTLYDPEYEAYGLCPTCEGIGAIPDKSTESNPAPRR